MIDDLLKNKYGEVPPGQELEALEPNTLIIEDEMLRKGFTATPNCILDDVTVSAAARLTYIILLSFAWKEESCFPGQTRLAKQVGVSRQMINQYLNELKERKYIAWRRRGLGKTNVYFILEVSSSRSEPDVNYSLHQDVKPGSHLDVNQGLHKEHPLEKDPDRKDSDHSKYRKVENQNKEQDGLYSEEIAEVIDGLSKRELLDPIHIQSNITQAQNLWRASKASEAKFIGLIHEAKQRTLRHSGSIRKIGLGGRGMKNRAPYFFKVLKTLVREAMLANFRQGFKPPP